MKVGVAVLADFTHGPLGGPSALRDPLAGRPVLARTLARVARLEDCGERLLYTHPEHAAAGNEAIAAAGVGDAVRLVADDTTPRPRRALLGAARRWNPHAWRGAPLGATWFDEYIEPASLPPLFERATCDALLLVDGHQPLLDLPLAQAMLRHYRENHREAPFVFTQAPPGLAGLLVSRPFVPRLIQSGMIVGQLFAYRPDSPELDLLTRPMCLRIDPRVAQTPGRWTADTRRARRDLEAAIGTFGEDVTAGQLAGWSPPADELPLEIELELTTATSLPDSTLTSSAFVDAPREAGDLEAIARLGGQLAGELDHRIVLGGHGDPLLHPRLGETLAQLRTAGAPALAMRTHLVELSDDRLDALFAAPVDLVEVRIDAFRDTTYAAVHGAARLAEVTGNAERLLAQRRARSAPRPIVIASLTRCAATLGEMDAFYDHWTRQCGWAVIHGWNDWGRREPDPLIHMAPLVRQPCRRLARRLTLLADGRAVACDQDLGGALELGDWTRQSLREIWGGAARASLLDAHAVRQWDGQGPCCRCREWFRW